MAVSRNSLRGRSLAGAVLMSSAAPLFAGTVALSDRTPAVIARWDGIMLAPNRAGVTG